MDSVYAYWALYNYYGVHGTDIQLVLEASDDRECSYCMPVLKLWVVLPLAIESLVNTAKNIEKHSSNVFVHALT